MKLYCSEAFHVTGKILSLNTAPALDKNNVSAENYDNFIQHTINVIAKNAHHWEKSSISQNICYVVALELAQVSE